MWTFLIFFASLASVTLQQQYCFSTDQDRDQVRHFGQRTAYRNAKGESFNYAIKGCTPKKLWTLVRHGTRLPDTDFIAGSYQNYPDLHHMIVSNLNASLGTLCPQDVALFKSWIFNPNITTARGYDLVEEGFDEMRNLAISFKPMIQEFANLTFDPNVYQFLHTDRRRCEDSYRAFFDGVFGPGSSIGQPARPLPVGDLRLFAYWGCQPYVARQANRTQYDLFVARPEMQQVISEVSQRLGTALNFANISLIWEMCRFEQAWNVSLPSPWCVAFTPEHISVLEYADDLIWYYAAGYGYEKNKFTMCQLVKDMLQSLSSNDGAKVTAYFAHIHDTAMLLTALGWDEDKTPLTYDNYDKQGKRKWVTSENGPFGANIAAVRYECENGKELVKFYLNENESRYRPCRSSVCSVDNILDYYQFYLNANCADVFCQ